MGMKQGYAMISGKPEMTEMFGKWGFTKIGLIANGAITIISAIMNFSQDLCMGKFFDGCRNFTNYLFPPFR